MEGPFVLISTSQGPFKSLDHGRTWRKLDTLDIKGNPNILSNGKYIFRVAEGGVERSTNQGGNYTVVLHGSVDALAISDKFLFAVASGRLYRSNEEGDYWYQVFTDPKLLFNEPTEREVLRWVHAVGPVVYVVSKRGDYRSEDGGATWTFAPRINPGPGMPGIYGMVKGDSYWLARTFGAWLQRSEDQGRSWTLVDPGLKAEQLEFFTSIDPFLFVGSRGSGFFRSGDQGATWTPMYMESEALESGSLVRFRDDLVLGNADGIFRSGNNGETWSSVPKGWDRSEEVALAVEGDRLFAATKRGLFQAVDSAGTWSLTHCVWSASVNPYATNLYAVAVKGPTLLVSSSVFSLYRSEDSGMSWNEVPNWHYVKRAWRFFVKDSLFFAPSSEGLYRGGRIGRPWKMLLRGTEYRGQKSWQNYGVQALAIHGETLFSGTDEGQVYASRDNGDSWTRLKPGLPKGFVSGLAVCGSSLFVMFEDKGIWRRDLADIEREELRRGGKARICTHNLCEVPDKP